MTKTSTSTQNQEQQNILESINAKWSIEQKFFNETKPIAISIYDMEKHQSRTVHRTWPRQKPIEQIGWENFLIRILDPATGKPYEQLDKKGTEVKQPDGLGPVRSFARTIIRYRDYDEKEYILTNTNVYGFSSLGECVSYHVHRPESYLKTIFDSRKSFDNKTQSFSEVTTGILSAQEIYTLLFSKENLDQIISENIITKNTPQVYLDKIRIKGRIEISNPCSFVMKNSEEAHAVEGKTWQERLERFRNLDFDTLFEWKYLKEKKEDDANSKNPSLYK
ncbi:MAG TPA: hypothetical protein VJ697_11005 [Nitrososphaeraceae archaeon]|nr:hypothetical protein [Nitrososphaeraceae archaeon]